MKKQFSAFLIFTSLLAAAQSNGVVKRNCGTGVPNEDWNNQFNAQVEAFKQNVGLQKAQAANYTIPVIFHVIHGGQAVGVFPNLSQSQINSQVYILNSDYAGGGLNSGNFTNTGFSPSLIANTGINFCLAKTDPTGATLAEPGIDRINYSAKGWANPNTFASASTFKNYIDNTVKFNTVWNVTKYLNIWITDVNLNVGLLGYSTFPPLSGLTGIPDVGTATNDGVWCWAMAIGDAGSLTPYYDKGRTASHEIGHYLGLRHIWGDANCGDDYCNDTPMQQTSNEGCPGYPSVTCTNAPKGDLFMNFMDYSYDACMYMFTNDQKSRIQTAMLNSPFRKNLSSGTASSPAIACSLLGVAERKLGLYTGMNIFPNPGNGSFYITADLSSVSTVGIKVYNLLGKTVFYNAAAPANQNQVELNLNDLPAGVYFVELDNGWEKAVKQLVLSN